MIVVFGLISEIVCIVIIGVNVNLVKGSFDGFFCVVMFFVND